MSPGWFKVQIGLDNSAAPDVCLVTLFILPHWVSKTRIKKHGGMRQQTVWQRVCVRLGLKYQQNRCVRLG